MIPPPWIIAFAILWHSDQVAAAPYGDPPAEVRYRNIDVLKGLPSSLVPVIMRRWSKALGVECVHCHEGEDFERGGKKTYVMARRMARMAAAVSEKYLKAEGGVTCRTCHRGSVRPARLPGDALDLELATWPENLETVREQHALTMSVFNLSLGVKCQHCHSESSWKSGTKDQHATAKRMASMFDEFPRHLGPRSGRMQCFTCHHGSTEVER